MTYLLMGLLILSLAATTLWGAKYDPSKDSFMSIDDTVFLRGFWCIIVVLVHIPAAYQNRIQDMLGSFAYIGVTFFFMVSAYGLKHGIQHKKSYMDSFWRRRLPPILIPAVIANAFGVVMHGLNGEPVHILSFIDIDHWVKVLLLYYAVFWLIYGVLPKLIKSGAWQDFAMCAIVVGFSLVNRLTDFHITFGWIVEPLGFAYGIIAAKNAEQIRKWNQTSWSKKTLIFLVSSGILGLLYLKFKPVVFFGDYLLKIVLGISITTFIFLVMTKVRVGNNINRFFGNISYEVYILHRGVFVLVALILPGANSGVFVFCSILISIMLAAALKKLCDPLIKSLA